MSHPPTELDLEVRAEACTCRATARRVREFLAGWLTGDRVLDDLELIVTEALANVAEHAYREAGAVPAQGRAAVHVLVTPGQRVDMTLTDWGRGMDPKLLNKPLPPPDSSSGRGLFLIRALADGVDVNCWEDRCVLTLHKLVEEKAWR